MNTSELIGPQLDYWVAKAEGLHIDGMRPECVVGVTPNRSVYSPSTNWAQGGPIIERECISLIQPEETFTKKWEATRFDINEARMRGPTLLIAAMRCYVTSKYGESVAEGQP